MWAYITLLVISIFPIYYLIKKDYSWYAKAKDRFLSFLTILYAIVFCFPSTINNVKFPSVVNDVNNRYVLIVLAIVILQSIVINGLLPKENDPKIKERIVKHKWINLICDVIVLVLLLVSVLTLWYK